jgi:uncharacterized phage-like protein YoqJ
VEIVRDWINNMLATIEPRRVVTGMAVGFDTYLAREALRQQIPLLAAIPYEGQEDQWPDGARTEYRKILKQAETVHIVEKGGYASWKYQKRNEWMVNNCDLLLAAWSGKPGGTANCVRYAHQVERRVELLPGLKPEAI